MRFTQSWLAVGAIVVSMTLPNASWAKSALDSRITRLENIVENEINISLINQLETLQQEIRELRGKIEEQEYALQKMHTQQAKAAARQEASTPRVTAEVTPVAVPAAVTAAVVSSEVAVMEIPEVATEQEPQESTEKSSYDVAYRHMSSKDYPQAITEFKDLLWQYPEGTFAPNAYYWLGEIYLAQWQMNKSDTALLAQAKESFNTVLERFGNHHKAVDALLKLGFIELDQENWLTAKELLSKVVKEHPGTSRARLAEARLQRMQQEGR